jgi:hypothetical protein
MSTFADTEQEQISRFKIQAMSDTHEMVDLLLGKALEASEFSDKTRLTEKAFGAVKFVNDYNERINEAATWEDIRVMMAEVYEDFRQEPSDNVARGFEQASLKFYTT